MTWERVAAAQAGLISRRQLNELGVDRWRVRNQIAARRWVELTSMVIATTTGPLSREQTMWAGVLHAGPGSLVGGLSAAELAGLKNWHRDEVTILVPKELEFDDDELPGVRFVRTRRNLNRMRSRAPGVPRAAIEPAILLFAGYQNSTRTAQGVLAASVQQGLTTPEDLLRWVKAMRPLRWARLFRRAVGDIAGGAQSLAEMDVRRMCRVGRLAPPLRQSRRRDTTGRWRFTDCHWRLPDGSMVILEVDGSFHMDVEHWEDDLARQRRLSHRDRTIVRCTARELRDEPERVAADLRALGVPGRAA